MAKERNYPLLVGLSAFLLIFLVFIVHSMSYYVQFWPEWLASNGWTLFVIISGPILAITVELSGVFRDKPPLFIVTFILYLLGLVIIDSFVVAKSMNSLMIMYLLAGIIMLSYLLAMKTFFPKGEHFLVPVAVGFTLSIIFFEMGRHQGISALIGALWLGGWGIILAGGFAAIGHYKDRSILYAASGMAVALLAIFASIMLTMSTTGFSS